jgi:ubiquinone/menaquinone biosynthesis C-methylase UbiE
MTQNAEERRPSREEIAAEIKRRKPWYQRIEFPAYSITTTDDPTNAMIDGAWDNKIGDLTLEQASIMRPQPKWAEIQKAMPPVAGLDVLEIGSACGYFSFEFVKAGARTVVGLDVSDQWLNNARWAASVLGYRNVEFRNVDFMNYSASERRDAEGLLSDASDSIPLPNKKVDVVFMSTVIDHLFFPMFAIYKMLRIARRHVVIDCPVMHFDMVADKKALTLDVAPDGSHHGFLGDARFWKTYVSRLGVPSDHIHQHLYNDGRGMCMVINCDERKSALWGA